jgi:hypothetical protein
MRKRILNFPRKLNIQLHGTGSGQSMQCSHAAIKRLDQKQHLGQYELDITALGYPRFLDKSRSSHLFFTTIEVHQELNMSGHYQNLK